ncbi:MAG: PIN domain-containing protein [Muribaculaceae bacterium]|nr:PIN domain-containing protein [Muribaculaceae bacterium]
MKKSPQYLLDTNICIFLLRNKFAIDKHIEEAGIKNCFLSEITIAELAYGAYCSSNPREKMSQLRNLLKLFNIIPIFDTIETYANFKAELRKKGLPIDDFDLLIGAAAAANKLILITDNIKHFERLDIKVENWVKR